MATVSLANGRSQSCEVGIASASQNGSSSGVASQPKRPQSFSRRNNSMTRLQAQVVRRSMRKHMEQTSKGIVACNRIKTLQVAIYWCHCLG